MSIAYWSGLAVGSGAFIGSLLLLWRRITNRRVQAVSSLNDVITIGGLVLVVGMGLYNVVFGHYNVLYTIAPWIRGIVTFTPHPELMRGVPVSYKLHVLSALALLGFSPFSRLVHIWSACRCFTLRGVPSSGDVCRLVPRSDEKEIFSISSPQRRRVRKV